MAKTHKGDHNNHLKTPKSDLLFNLLFGSQLLMRRATVRDSLLGSERQIGVSTPKKEKKKERKKERKKESKRDSLLGSERRIGVSTPKKEKKEKKTPPL